jgi:hypothetical protein
MLLVFGYDLPPHCSEGQVQQKAAAQDDFDIAPSKKSDLGCWLKGVLDRRLP